MTSCILSKERRVFTRKHKIKSISDAKLYKIVKDRYLNYDNINFKKVKIAFEKENKKIQFRGHLRIRRDSIIWLSLSKMGIEGMRLKLTPDSVSLIDRFNKQYLISTYDYLNKKFGIYVNFNLIQSIITNQLPQYKVVKGRPFFRNYKGKKDKTHYIFQRHKKGSFFRNKMNEVDGFRSTLEILRINPDVMRLENIRIYDNKIKLENNIGTEESVLLDLSYLDYKQFDTNCLFPEKISAKLTKEKSQYYPNDIKTNDISKNTTTVRISVIVKKMEINRENINYPFRISSKYKKINE